MPKPAVLTGSAATQHTTDNALRQLSAQRCAFSQHSSPDRGHGRLLRARDDRRGHPTCQRRVDTGNGRRLQLSGQISAAALRRAAADGRKRADCGHGAPGIRSRDRGDAAAHGAGAGAALLLGSAPQVTDAGRPLPAPGGAPVVGCHGDAGDCVRSQPTGGRVYTPAAVRIAACDAPALR